MSDPYRVHARDGRRASACRAFSSCLVAVAALTGAGAAFGQWSNETFWAANSGRDSSSCGAAASPCRSIGQAIANAPLGAYVQVGPGRYGDLNRNGAYDAGDEGPRTAGRTGLLQIEKSVRVLSTHGAELTVIDFGPSALSPRAVVGINTSGVYFGGVGKGFTLVGEDTVGIRVEGTRRNWRIAGNIVSGFNGMGIYVYAVGDAVTISDNLVVRNAGRGLFVNVRRPSGATGPIHIDRNTLRDNGSPVRLVATNATFSGNVIDGGRSLGVEVLAGSAAIVMERNFFIGNSGGAIDIVQRLSDTAPPIIERFALNTVVGNAGFGVRERGRAIDRLEQNNIYGNGYGGGVAPTVPNCGLVVDGGYPGGNVIATNNFWGAATGPGRNPADNAGAASGCGAASASTVVAPFAAAPFAVDVVTDD